MAFLLLLFAAWPLFAQGFGTDPASNLDSVRDVGIKGNRIASISRRGLAGGLELDAAGSVISPGFIDLDSEAQDPEDYRLKTLERVTTALELEVGVSP